MPSPLTQSRSTVGRVAIPLDALPSRPTLVPEDVWQSYQEEMERVPTPRPQPRLLQEVPPVLSGSSSDRDVAHFALSQTHLFEGVAPEGLAALCESARQGVLRDGEYLFTEGQAADSFFVLLDGNLEVLLARDDKEISLRHIHPGEALGIFGLLSGSARAASTRAVHEAVVLEVPAQALNALIAKDASVRERVALLYQQRLLETFLGSSEVFREFSPDLKAQLVSRFVERSLKEQDALVQPGEVSNLIAVVISGQLLLEAPPKPGSPPKMFKLDPGQFLAVTSALSGLPARMKVYAGRDTTLVVLEHRDLADVMREHPELRGLSAVLPVHARALDRDTYCGHTGVAGL